ncbi:hypothetical protein DPV78_012107 [Talaromyces pinophilus]|nr:hypothetical protein DPV78_012107 [Talaromyces pinophilus]
MAGSIECEDRAGEEVVKCLVNWAARLTAAGVVLEDFEYFEYELAVLGWKGDDELGGRRAEEKEGVVCPGGMVERESEEGAGAVETARPVMAANWVRRRRNTAFRIVAGVPGFIGGTKRKSEHSSIGRVESTLCILGLIPIAGLELLLGADQGAAGFRELSTARPRCD